jgi:hypothetical protein
VARDKVNVSRYGTYIDCPVAIHLMSILWLTNVGYLLDEDIDGNVNYGNRLDEKAKDKLGYPIYGRRIFRKYFVDYGKWKKEAIKEVSEQYKKNKNTILLTLDFKSFFNSVRQSESEMKEAINNLSVEATLNFGYLTSILFSIHAKYDELLYAGSKDEKLGYPLPVGLLSSGVIANWYLREFDKAVQDKVAPLYYGRYVDDVIMVVENRMPGKVITKTEVTTKFLVESDVMEFRNGVLKLRDVVNIEVQNDKVNAYAFYHDEPMAIISRMEKELNARSSEYRMLPTKAKLRHDFDHSAFQISFESPQKIHSIKEMEEDKFGIASYLARIIEVAARSVGAKNGRDEEQLLKFFIGWQAVNFHQQWERVCTFFVLTRKHNALVLFVENCMKAIEIIEVHLKEEGEANRGGRITKFIKNYLIHHLKISVSTAIALDHCGEGLEFEPESLSVDLAKRAIIVRSSNMIRHRLLSFPMLNYTDGSLPSDQGKVKSLIDSQLSGFADEDAMILVDDRLKYSPRYLSYHELYSFHMMASLYTDQNKKDVQ